MSQTFHGSCHCGAVRFACDIDLARGTSRCNCSLCTKSRYWKAIVPTDTFRLLQGLDMLWSYRFGTSAIQHLFCIRCGIKPFGRGANFYAVNVACLDDVEPEELAAARVRFEDGRHDNWECSPVETRYL